MPGAYAHITLVNLAREPARLEAGPGMPGPAGLALGRWLKCCELGVVSPDYPYLAVGATGAAGWADLMHYLHTGDMVKAGVETVKGLTGISRRISGATILRCPRMWCRSGSLASTAMSAEAIPRSKPGCQRSH